MTFRINPSYQSQLSFIERLPDRFEEEGEVIYKGRNTLKKFRINDQIWVVKSFKTPHIINRIAYSFFRLSKAERSYRYALKLIEKGINTPVPVAYLTEKRKGLIAGSFYISAFSDYPKLLRDLLHQPLEEVKDLAEAFAHFTASIHSKEVLHIDYSPGNIMYNKVNDQYNFCLVDLNRVKFGEVDKKSAAFNLRKLWGRTETILFIAQVYAQDRNFDVAQFAQLTLHYRTQFWVKFTKKHPNRKYLLDD
ncbi:hypothetical protein FACS189426_05720 [Bacteroidia bacterium]|nr:hypothetical protein FACS189426_05720 [Bacteroidia bacterium]GHV71185.1 hypothetical protein FACS189420_5330 [Bacteroidia bacterium]